jgi:hypothetical protein
MMFYHVSNTTILSGPHSADSQYVRDLTRCGTPSVLNLADYGLVPEIKPALGEYQSWGEPVVSADAVTFPVVDWDAAQIAEYQAQQLADRRAAMVCTPRQARLVLAQAGLLTAVEAWIATASQTVQIEWQYANEIRRDWPPITDAAVALELTDAQLDDLFTLAPTL